MASNETKEMQAEDWFAEGVATFGDRLEAARAAAGLSQEGLARRLGVRLTTVQAWEEDQVEPRANRMQMLAGMLNVPLTWLMAGIGAGVTPPEAVGEDGQTLAATLKEMARLKAQMASLNATIVRVEARIEARMSEDAA